ncbi:scytalone dehydratase [Grosmannia clavigera kw1407]|uniref:Scytalone dehydratase n=1 Tax=Grosmannia clavigera (strain kw1407 / UAMH 11150) TaxID=655863 RepID=F0XGI1_GROCL|nr:scytalone dehydratase [Grosmannia clavigera kw1407]EFX02941.1 scytalone dehydratase [Grosmannia clavigera kw1407]
MITDRVTDVISCQAALFEWAESFDTKDWGRLSEAIAPTLHVDYTDVMGKSWKALPAADFVQMASNTHFLGNVRIKTQHLIGAEKWISTGADTITGYHQMRVAHQKYKDDGLTEVLRQGHAHGNATVRYRKVDGVWKFAGLTPDIRWSESEYQKNFDEE